VKTAAQRGNGHGSPDSLTRELTMRSLAISRFHKNTGAMEIRYPSAYVLWDRAGQIATEIQSIFKLVEMTFLCDNRYNVSVLLDKASIVDGMGKLDDEAILLFDSFFKIVMMTLTPTHFTRIGTRVVYHLLCDSADKASMIINDLYLLVIPQKKLFDVSPKIVDPT
jgi:hypothetical protein